MEHHRHDHFTADLPATIFVGIIGTHASHRHTVAAFSRRQALDGMIRYLNFIMDGEVLPMGASETDTIKAIGDNLYAEVEIVECDPWQGDCCGGSAFPALFG